MEPTAPDQSFSLRVVLPNDEIRSFSFAQKQTLHSVKTEILAAYHREQNAPERHLELRAESGDVLVNLFEPFVACEDGIKKQFSEGQRTFQVSLAAPRRKSATMLFTIDSVLAMTENLGSTSTAQSDADAQIDTPEIDALLAETSALFEQAESDPPLEPSASGDMSITALDEVVAAENEAQTSPTNLEPESIPQSEPEPVAVQPLVVQATMVSGASKEVKMARVVDMQVRSAAPLAKSVSVSSLQSPVMAANPSPPTSPQDQVGPRSESSPTMGGGAPSGRRAHRSMAVSSAIVAQLRNVAPITMPKVDSSAAVAASTSPRWEDGSVTPTMRTSVSTGEITASPRQDNGTGSLERESLFGTNSPAPGPKQRASSVLHVVVASDEVGQKAIAPAILNIPPAHFHRPSYDAAALRATRQKKLQDKTSAAMTNAGTLRHSKFDDDDSDDSDTASSVSDSEEDSRVPQPEPVVIKPSPVKTAPTKPGHSKSHSHQRSVSSGASKDAIAAGKRKFRRAKKRTFDEDVRRRLNYGNFKLNSEGNAMVRAVELLPLQSDVPWMAAKPVVFGDRDSDKIRTPISIQRMSLLRQAPHFDMAPQDLANYRLAFQLKADVQPAERKPLRLIVHLAKPERAVALEVRLHESVRSVKSRAYAMFQQECPHDLLPIKDYVMELTESGIYLVDEEKGFQNAWVSSAQNRPEHMSLTERRVAEQSKDLCKEIAIMLDCPALMPYWLPVDNEQTHFRKNMSRNTVIQKRISSNRAAISKAPLSPSFPPQFRVIIFLNASASKTLMCNIHTTTSEAVADFVKKFKVGGNVNLDPTKCLLRVCGFSDVVLDDIQLSKLEYVRHCVERRRRIRFQIVEKVNPVTQMAPPQTSLEPKQLGVTVSHIPMNHLEKPRTRAWRLRDAGAAHELFYPSTLSNTIPQWSVKKAFEIRINRIESLINSTGANMTGQQLVIEAGLYFGGELLVDLKRTQAVPFSTNPVWNRILAFRDTCVSNIPRETRICFTTLAIDSKGNETPVAWVALNLFDYHDVLKMGPYQAFMWPNERANPIGVCGSNLTEKEKGNNRLCLEFDAYPASVAFTDVLSLPPATLPSPEHPSGSLEADLDDLLSLDPLWRPSEEEKSLLWRYRVWIRDNHPDKLAKIALCVPWTDPLQVAEMYRILNAWPRLQAETALELLDSRYADAKLRGFAVSCLESMEDSALLMHLLQLVQVLKYEPQHYSALAQFLVDRACENETMLGIPFFWYLHSELPAPETMERFGLVVEAFLLTCTPGFREELAKQMEVLDTLKHLAATLRNFPQSKRTDLLRELLPQVSFPDSFTLPLKPTQWISGSVDVKKCRVFDSAKAPLMICFKSADPVASMDDVLVIFKAGDDLRQDALTVQMLNIMDQIWKSSGLDLHLTPYAVSVTSENHGLIEVVPDSTTTARIQREAGGATAAFKMTPLANWIKSTNPNTDDYEVAVDNFVLSCAGYCVASYVLGIGDRHNDNIMIDKFGHLFHIDFGHFLGNFKSWKGIIKREKAPFVLTPEFAFAMGGIDSDRFKYFCRLCCRAYNLVRRKANLLINLFAMMLSTGIPELRSDEDLLYLQDALATELTDEEAAEHFMELIEESLNSKATELNFFFHILAH